MRSIHHGTGRPSGEDNLELLKVLLEEEGIAAAPESAIPRRPQAAPVPLSFAQERLWFIQQLDPTSCVYHIQLRRRIRGPLNVRALEQAFEELVRRHESLRTRIAVRDGRPVQIISAPQPVKLSLVDLTHLPEDERGAHARKVVLEQTNRPFDLAQGSPVRVGLVRLGAEDHVLAVTMHHIISDGWSSGILLRECTTLYEAFDQGRPCPLPELPIQYADYAQWQREWLQGPVLESQLVYWRQQLAGALPVLELPADHARPTLPSHEGAVHTFALGTELTEGLKTLSQREGVTLFMTLLAAFDTLLLRHTGQEDLLVGSPIAGRSRVETEGIFGLFVNTLVLRANLSGNPTFRELLQRVREVALGAYAHQDLPFEKLVEELRPERRLGHNPLFQVMFVFQNVPVGELTLAGLTLEPFRIDRELSMFDLSLVMVEQGGRLLAEIVYSRDVFEAASIERMAERFRTLLEGIVAQPDRRIHELPLLTEGEREQLLERWNETYQEFPDAALLHGLFEEQACRTPEAVAVVFEDRALTYYELDRRANQLARHLRKLGVGPEVLVGLFLERSLEMVIGLFGVLKAGGAYVPLDPGYPAERVAYTIEDSRTRIVLTQSSLLPRLPMSAARLVCLDTDWPRIAEESGANLDSGVTAENLAYVIYTSGSTGKPKGVAIEHHSPVALMYWARAVFRPEEIVGVLASTSICFDLSIFELFVPLSWGGTVILAANIFQLPQLPARERVKLINTVPSAITELLRLGRLPGSVRTVNLAGEPLATQLVQLIYQQNHIERVYDLYGPSETTTYSTYALRRSDGPATIGRPLANEQVYLLDGRMNPVPIGVPGEVYIGGVGVARGYLNRPELTAERFVLDPFSADPKGRLYRTGDLARYRPDGNIEFLGRIDHQVKIRGFRIELGEIEAVLQRHAAVREAVVVAREDEPGVKRLVAYLVSASKPAPSVSELRSFLLKGLPDYMIPSVFVVIDSLPLTPSGKVDRRALPVPSGDWVATADRYVAPRTAVEEVVAGMWAEVLRVARVGVEDNFFELGGHSLLATQIVSRIRDHFQVELPLRALFERPTVAGLAEIVDRQAGRPAGDLAHGSEPIRPMPGAEEIESLSVTEVKARLLELARGRTGRTP